MSASPLWQASEVVAEVKRKQEKKEKKRKKREKRRLEALAAAAEEMENSALEPEVRAGAGGLAEQWVPVPRPALRGLWDGGRPGGSRLGQARLLLSLGFPSGARHRAQEEEKEEAAAGAGG